MSFNSVRYCYWAVISVLTLNSKASLHCPALRYGAGPCHYSSLVAGTMLAQWLVGRTPSASPPTEIFVLTRPRGSFPAPWSCPTAYGQVQPRQPATFSTSSGSQPHPCQQGLNPALGREPASTPAPSSGALF